MLSNLPLQVVLYFNAWYDALYVLIMIALYIWKGTALPYPGPLGGLLALELCLILLLLCLEYARLKLASRGNKTERATPLVLSLLLSFPNAYLFFYFMFQQVYVTRLDWILSITGLVIIALEMLISLLVVPTLRKRTPPRHAPRRAHAARPPLASPARLGGSCRPPTCTCPTSCPTSRRDPAQPTLTPTRPRARSEGATGDELTSWQSTSRRSPLMGARA